MALKCFGRYLFDIRLLQEILEQRFLHSLLRAGWMQERIRECFYKLSTQTN